MNLINGCYGYGYGGIPTNLVVKELVFNYLGTLDIDSYLTNTIIKAAQDATDRAITAAEAAEGALTGVIPANAIVYPNGDTQLIKNMESPSINDFNSINAAISYSELTGKEIRGIHKTIDVSEVPNLENFSDTEFVIPVGEEKLHYASKDYRNIKKSKITNTINYTGWTQDKCFEYNGVIYAPYQMSTQHTSLGQRIAWSRSFDQGNTWTQPEIIMDAASNATRGWNCFCMGESGGRLYAVMEWRTDTSTDDTEFYLYSRPLDRTRKVTGGILKKSTEGYLTVTIENHGLFAGDFIFFTGTGIAGLSGKTAVTSVIDKNTIRINADASLNGLVVDNSGQIYYCGIEFAAQDWQRQLITSYATIGTTTKLTHIHSFSDVDGESFIIGFGFGGTSSEPTRQVGYFHVTNIHSTSAVLTKYRITSSVESYSTEPCVVYNPIDNHVYLTTRNQSQTGNAKITRSILNSGNWYSKTLPFKSVYCNLPLVIKDNRIYVFGTERGKDQFINGNIDYIGDGVQLAKTYMYELEDYSSSNWKVSVLTEDYHGGDTSNSSLGVGSAIYAFGKLMYFYGAESSDSQHIYATNAKTLENRNVFNGNGMQQDIMLLEITLDSRINVQDFALTGYDSKTLPMVRSPSNIRTIDAPIAFNYPLKSNILLDTDNGSIGNNTVAGSDSKYLALTSSSSASSGRGAYIMLYGANHLSSPNRGLLVAPVEFLINTPVIKPWGNNSTTLGSSAVRFTTGYLKNLNINSLSIHEDNAAAITGGLVAGDLYRTATGQLMVTF